jgi:hypothetical protein
MQLQRTRQNAKEEERERDVEIVTSDFYDFLGYFYYPFEM